MRIFLPVCNILQIRVKLWKERIRNHENTAKLLSFDFLQQHFSRWMDYSRITYNVIFGGHPRSFDLLYIFAKMSQCLCVRHPTFLLLISPFSVRPLSLEIWCKLLEWTACGREGWGRDHEGIPPFYILAREYRFENELICRCTFLLCPMFLLTFLCNFTKNNVDRVVHT